VEVALQLLVGEEALLRGYSVQQAYEVLEGASLVYHGRFY
jgi:hypothetical protein